MDGAHDDVFLLAQKDAERITTEKPSVFEAFFAMLAIAPSGKDVIAPQYSDHRNEILRRFGLENAYEKFLIELCWSYPDTTDFFSTPGNEAEFATFPARAGKVGLNVGLFLDALLAIACIDDQKKHPGTLEVFHRFVAAEYVCLPERFAARQAQQAHARKLRVKTILRECGLAPEMLFERLNIGLGPERGGVMEGVYEMIRGESAGTQFGIHTEYLQECARNAADQLSKEGLSV